MKKLRSGLIVLALLTGCALSAEDKNLISVNAAAGVGDERDWNNMTDAQKREAHKTQTQALLVLDHNVNGKPYPPGWEPEGTAPVASEGK